MVPHQILMSLQRLHVANPLRCYSVGVEVFWMMDISEITWCCQKRWTAQDSLLNSQMVHFLMVTLHNPFWHYLTMKCHICLSNRIPKFQYYIHNTILHNHYSSFFGSQNALIRKLHSTFTLQTSLQIHQFGGFPLLNGSLWSQGRFNISLQFPPASTGGWGPVDPQ